MEFSQFYINIARFHPLIVHLPIGILFFALILELLKRWRKRLDLDFSINAALFLGAASSIVAAFTGWFLSDEGGYSEDGIFWHKWTGVSLAIMATAVLFLQSSKKASLNRLSFPALILTSLLLIVVGHLGGNITHGEDYLFTKPVEEVSLNEDVEQLQVYGDLIAPILDRKCNSCHNESKAKGDLIMTNQAGLFSGGKSGQIFDFTTVTNSELLRRIHLPLDEEKHMPPRGKLQLEENDIQLLTWWIENQACVDCVVAVTERSETISTILEEMVSAEQFDVEPVSNQKLAELQSSGIPINTVAEDHPMVIVNLSFQKDLSSSTFKELNSISENILELNLAGSNVSDDMLTRVADFENLRKLQLQNTDITDAGVEALAELEKLESLNLYQTDVSDIALEVLAEISTLDQLYLWNSEATASGVAELIARRPTLKVQYELADDLFGENALGPPVIEVAKPIFKGSSEVVLASYLAGTDIYYTLDGSDPDTLSSKYEQPFSVTNTTLVKAVNYKDGWKMSEPIAQQLLAIKTVPTSVSLSKPPKDKYKANGPGSLIDGKKGSQRFTDGLWLGYEGEDMIATFELAGDEPIMEVTVSALSEQGSWIFYPKEIEVQASEDGKSFTEVGRLPIELTEPSVLESGMNYFTVPAALGNSRYAKVIVRSHLKNPDWHPSPGGKCWIFIDEILLN